MLISVNIIMLFKKNEKKTHQNKNYRAPANNQVNPIIRIELDPVERAVQTNNNQLENHNRLLPQNITNILIQSSTVRRLLAIERRKTTQQKRTILDLRREINTFKKNHRQIEMSGLNVRIMIVIHSASNIKRHQKAKM